MGNDKELDAHHRATVEKIFSHPVSHNIQWHDVLSLLQKVASVTKEHEGRYTVTLGAETETFDVNRWSTCDGCSGEPGLPRSRNSGPRGRRSQNLHRVAPKGSAVPRAKRVAVVNSYTSHGGGPALGALYWA